MTGIQVFSSSSGPVFLEAFGVGDQFLEGFKDGAWFLEGFKDHGLKFDRHSSLQAISEFETGFL